MARKEKHNEETKVNAVLEGLRGETSIAEVCRKYGISDSLYYRWKDQFLEGGKRALSKRQETPNAEAKRKLAEYERVIGKITVENTILKKTLEQ